MTATIYNFPSSIPETQYLVRLYNDTEVEVLLACLNIFSQDDIKYHFGLLEEIDPMLAIFCLRQGKDSNFFSSDFKTIIEIILNNVETL